MKTIKRPLCSALLVASFVATNAAARPIKVPGPSTVPFLNSVLDQFWALVTSILS
jgi:hypothetical protein